MKKERKKDGMVTQESNHGEYRRFSIGERETVFSPNGFSGLILVL